MENNVHSDELQHHGIKGMRWGQRRYQNKDGSLTPAGLKRYNKEVEKLKAETAKVKAAEKVAANRAKTQSKLDKLEAKKQELEERKKALKDKSDNDADKAPEETVEQRRERLLKSTDPKELYKYKDDLTSFELNERLQRIDLEARLQGKIPVEHQKTGMDYMNDLRGKIDTATNLYRSVDNAFSTVTNSAIGKTLAKTLGIETPKKGFNPDEFIAKARERKLTMEELEKGNKALKNLKSVEDEGNRRDNKKKADEDFAKKQAEAEKAAKDSEARKKEAQKQVDDYNKKWRKGESDDKVGEPESSTYSKTGDDIADNKTATGRGSKTTRLGIEQIDRAETDGKIYGEGTSKFSGWGKNDTVIDADYREVVNNAGSRNMSNVSNSTYSIGQSRVAGLLSGPTKSSNSSSNSKSSESSEDLARRAQKAADELSKAAKKSSEAVSNVSVDDSFVQDILKRNDDLLNR